MARLIVLPCRLRWQMAAYLAVLIAAGLMPMARAAERAQDADQALLEEQLASGEFAPAFDRAQHAQGPRREQLLGEIAMAQANAGEKQAALATAGSMRDDVSRSQIIGELRQSSPAPRGARGGGGMANFQPLMSLIQETVAPDTWDDVGGPGTMQQFVQGVYVDASGVVRPALEKDAGRRLTVLRHTLEQTKVGGHVRKSSPLRKISLPKLEREIQLRLAAGRPLDEEMHVLAGLQRIQYISAYPETGDLVIAGPAGDWTLDRENRLVSTESGSPVVQLDDLVTILRHTFSSRNGEFGCSINPTEAGLAKVKAFLEASSGKPLKPGQRGKWLKQVRDQLGRQDVEVYHIDPHSRVASVIVEADYRMKLVGIGLEEGTLDVPSYLKMIKVKSGEAARPLDVLRWWFTINYDALLTNPDRDVFEIRGQGVKVLSESEFLTATGQQVHTGQSDPLNAQFAHNFTKHFAALAAKYPVYADLRNIYDLALATSLIKTEGLADRAGWHMVCFRDPNQYQVARGQAPKSVETVINHRVVNGVN
ncbi:MAG TPA: DUF1598 domain-containing protein, partial [Pirellulales bacterium]|nr:DUF1598 domain-containing protein [Pirellulales bacterium]